MRLLRQLTHQLALGQHIGARHVALRQQLPVGRMDSAQLRQPLTQADALALRHLTGAKQGDDHQRHTFNMSEKIVVGSLARRP